MDPKVLQSIWPIFAAEAREQAEAIGTQVLGLEHEALGATSEVMVSLRRLVHSLKGSAASLGLEDIERVAHAIEDALARCKPQERIPRGLVEVILRGLAGIEDALTLGDA